MTAQPAAIPMQRSFGEAAVRLGLRAGRAHLQGLRQRGSAKAILPHAGAVPEIVFLNTSGGLTGGDLLSYALTLEDGVRAIATTQTAERAYRAGRGRAQVEVTMEVGAGGWLDWLPQETILFDDAALSRRTRIVLAPGAGCLALEGAALDHPAVLGQARAFASLVLVAPGAADALAPLRAVLDEPGVEGAASALDGRVMCRLRAGDGWPLRRQIARALAVLRRGAPLPRVWQGMERIA